MSGNDNRSANQKLTNREPSKGVVVISPRHGTDPKQKSKGSDKR